MDCSGTYVTGWFVIFVAWVAWDDREKGGQRCWVHECEHMVVRAGTGNVMTEKRKRKAREEERLKNILQRLL